ncbi:DUF2065 domain-containing protein [Ferrovum sp.]|jgi:hypothetical protein|nr:DUF2065 domain-containing protein [Ferrovum sp.]MBW8067596.1 DUF2065 family protein [Ferrovum sp.]
MEVLLRTFALVLVLEGILPFLVPERWRQTVIRLSQMSDRQVRSFGFGAIVLGVVLFQCVVWVTG